ncbi:MAG: metallophosphoesterase [Desulfuromonadales bacterium]
MFLVTVLFAGLFALNGCSGGSDITGMSGNQQSAQKGLTINGSLESALGKEVEKSVGAAANSIGSVSAVDAFTGTTISSASVDIIDNKFSGLAFTLPSSKSVFLLVAKLNNGTAYRAIIPVDVSGQPSGLFTNNPVTIVIGLKSESITQSVEAALKVKGRIGVDSGASVPSGYDFAAVSNLVVTYGGGVLSYGANGITIVGSMDPAAMQFQFIYTSDPHYGIKRAAFSGYSSATQVNGALINVMNGLSGVTLNCTDSGINACKPLGAVDFIVNTGDISNRSDGSVYPYKNAPAAATWPQFAADYLTTLNLKDKVGNKAPIYLVPGNHDVSNAIGFYKAPLNATSGLDATSYVQIYNMMMKPATPLTNAAFIGSTPSYATAAASYAGNRVVTSRDWNGVHLVFVGMWPDSVSRPLIDNDLKNVPATTPVIIFTHDQPNAESKHFTNPISPFDINATNQFENLLSDKFAEATPQGTPYSDAAAKNAIVSTIEQRALVAWLKTHKNIVAYFHGNDNANEFYTYTGPDNDISLNVFRVDSPMKGNFSATDATKLSFHVVSVDPTALKMTVREYLWNTKQWGASTTVSLAPRSN